MPTALIAPTTAAANSTDVTLAAGQEANLGLYTAAGGPVPAGVVATIARRNPSGTYDHTGNILTSQKPNAVLSGAGIYRIQKPATDVAIGVNQD